MEIVPELNPFLPVQCTKEFTGEKPTKQRFCYCLDCNCTPENKKTICEPCAFACHCNHRIVYAGEGPCVCQCPDCKAKTPVKHIPFIDTEILSLDPSEIEKGKCTFIKTGPVFFIQRSYRCKTCNQKFGEGVCSVCARTCHSGHELIETGINPFYCDCGSNGIKKEGFKCLCKEGQIQEGQIIDLPFEIPAKCTSTFANGKVYNQRGFACKTCGITEENPICEICAVKCHNGHDLVDLKLKPFTECGCQKYSKATGCKCLSETDEKFVPSICAEPQPLNERCDCCCEYEEEEEECDDNDNDGKGHKCHCHHHHDHDHCDCGSCGCHHKCDCGNCGCHHNDH